jgi:NAD(P)-dependent dehydrogenase (short-subunit alcohol dehydrogenase family)
VLVARDRERAERTLARLQVVRSGIAHTVHYADLSRLSAMKRVGAEITAAEPRIDVLINNAGCLFATRRLTEDGLESTFATNHMAYFVLTHVLRERLIGSAPARVVNTASDAHARETLDCADLQFAKGYGFRAAYGRSKLCNILFTRELARRLAGTGVTANCLHPGFVATGLGQRDNFFLGLLVRAAMRFAKPAVGGGNLIVHLAGSPEVADVTGTYWADGRPATPSPQARNDHDARRLWAESLRIAGFADGEPARQVDGDAA